MRKNNKKHFWAHEYTVTKVDPTLNRLEVAVVTGSRDATAKQEEFESEGYFAIVHNKTTGETEYRTPGCEK